VLSSIVLKKQNSGYDHHYLSLIINPCSDYLIFLSIKVLLSICVLEKRNGVKRPTPDKE